MGGSYEEIYMDHAATTELLPEARAAMEPYLTIEYGNASTGYEPGKRAKKALEEAREMIAQSIGAEKEEIFFTSGGSESDNWVIKGVGRDRRRRGNHIITSQIEHHAILNSCKYMEGQGLRVTYLPTDAQGIVSVRDFGRTIRRDTIMASIMYGNNEIGSIEPIREIGSLARRRGILFHTDAVQAVGQIPINVKELPVDFLSASGHKFHGPKGVGFLYVRKGVRIPSFIHGGAQESGYRAGTENVAGIVGMAEALRIAVLHMDENMRKVTQLREMLVKKVLREIPEVRYNGHPINRLPGNASFSFRGIEASSLLILLEEEGICASAGSACTTGEESLSHVIRAIRLPEDYARGTIRFSLGTENNSRQIDKCVRILKNSVQVLRQSNEEPISGTVS